MRPCRRGTILGLVTVAMAAFANGEAQAQRYQYQYHHHHDAAGHMIDHAGHHIDQYGRHTGAAGVYHNQYGYVYQQPVYTPNAGSAVSNTTTAGQQTVPLNVVPNSTPAGSVGIADGGVIRIHNPADSIGEVKFAVNGTALSVRPGETKSILNDRLLKVEFDTGGPAGYIRYTVRTGTYKFKVSDTGWNLFRAADQSLVADVPPGPGPFPMPDSIDNEPRSPIEPRSSIGPRPGLVPID